MFHTTPLAWATPLALVKLMLVAELKAVMTKSPLLPAAGAPVMVMILPTSPAVMPVTPARVMVLPTLVRTPALPERQVGALHTCDNASAEQTNEPWAKQCVPVSAPLSQPLAARGPLLHVGEPGMATSGN